MSAMRRLIVLVCFVFVCACKREPSVTTETLIDGAVGQLDVDVRGDGGVTLDGHAVADESDLVARTRDAARATPVLNAVIHVDDGVAYEHVIETMNALKRGGVVHMTFAVAGTLDASR